MFLQQTRPLYNYQISVQQISVAAGNQHGLDTVVAQSVAPGFPTSCQLVRLVGCSLKQASSLHATSELTNLAHMVQTYVL